MEYTTFLIRILTCFLLGILVGIERQYRHRLVGIRTIVLVCLGSFMFMIVSFNLITNDQTRIAAQIVSGIGFLGAGVILRDGTKIKGLNTAATLWCVASIGVLTASGMLFEATIGTLLVLFANIFLRLIAQRVMEKVKMNDKEECVVSVLCEKKTETVIRTLIAKHVERNDLILHKIERNVITEDNVEFKAVIVTSRVEMAQELVNKLSIEPGVVMVKWDHKKYIKTDNEDDSEDINE